MTFSDEMKEFRRTHRYSRITMNGVTTRFLLCGNEDSRQTLVYLVGGTGFSYAWFEHIQKMEQDYRILTFDYPYGIETMESLADHTMKLIKRLGIRNPVFIGASLGGMLAQVIARRYSDKIAGVCLYSTCSLSKKSIQGLKNQYRSYGILLPVMKIVPYSWIRSLLLKVSKKQVGMQEGTEEEKKWLEEFFSWVYYNYTKKKDVHMTGLMIDIPKLKPITKREYAKFDRKALLILPMDDKAFPEEAQKDLLDMMPNACVKRLDGGHIATLYKVDVYVNATKEFLENSSL